MRHCFVFHARVASSRHHASNRCFKLVTGNRRQIQCVDVFIGQKSQVIHRGSASTRKPLEHIHWNIVCFKPCSQCPRVIGPGRTKALAGSSAQKVSEMFAYRQPTFSYGAPYTTSYVPQELPPLYNTPYPNGVVHPSQQQLQEELHATRFRKHQDAMQTHNGIRETREDLLGSVGVPNPFKRINNPEM